MCGDGAVCNWLHWYRHPKHSVAPFSGCARDRSMASASMCSPLPPPPASVAAAHRTSVCRGQGQQTVRTAPLRQAPEYVQRVRAKCVGEHFGCGQYHRGDVAGPADSEVRNG